MQWFRLYSEFAYDPKIQSMGETLQRRYIMLLCLQCNGYLVTATEEEIACALRISDDELQKTKQVLLDKGLIDENWGITAWDKRQYVSDSSADRVRRYREKKKRDGNGAQPLRKRNGNVTVTPPDTDTDTEATPPLSPPSCDGGETCLSVTTGRKLRNAFAWEPWPEIRWELKESVPEEDFSVLYGVDVVSRKNRTLFLHGCNDPPEKFTPVLREALWRQLQPHGIQEIRVRPGG